MRGRTFKNAWVIFDEAQNSTPNQMKMALTRIGDGSKMVVTGDINQTDRAFMQTNGLKDFIGRMHSAGNKNSAMCLVNFDLTDIQRHPMVSSVLQLYGEE